MLKIGIIGTDAAAHLHVGILLTDTKSEISGCYTSDSRESMVFARQYRLVSYSTLEALFKYTDAIDIACDSPEIYSFAEKSLKKMKHVFIAQPGRLSLTEVQNLVKLAGESGVVLQLGTGYRFCSAYDSLVELKQKPKLIEIRHQLLCNGEDIFARLNAELVRDLDLVIGIMHTDIGKTDVKTWTKSEGSFDLLNCRLECDNGSSINLVMQTVSEGDPKLEVTLHFSETVVTANVFKSIVEKQYRSFDVEDSIILDAYNEKTIHKNELKNFYMAACNDSVAVRRIEEQLRCIAAADYIVDRVRQIQYVTSC